LPLLSPARLDRARADGPAAKPEPTVLYLAYGSNLCYETFQDRRGVRPLAQVNVQVPELRLTFDLPGIPYTEPCFANTARRRADGGDNSDGGDDGGKEKEKEKGERRWTKGLVGVVYEVTSEDYAHIIATEGGGSAYHDVLVDCYPLEHGRDTVPRTHPDVPPFKAHTLFAPRQDPDDPSSGSGGRLSRPDPSYAQPSARYLKLITDGADECSLPAEYREYLGALRPYTITTQKQRLGAFIFLSLWGPFIALVFALQEAFKDSDGRSPDWLVQLSGAIFAAVWSSYDTFFHDVFGDGERTMDEHDQSDRDVCARRGPARRW
ncbi:hypothetical protein BDY21DRAFT_266875, partial [Lineolata rhizophorae]